MPSSETTATTKQVLTRLVAGGVRPPWAQADGPTQAETVALWHEAARKAKVQGNELMAAANAWLSQPAGNGRWWPAPVDVIALVPPKEIAAIPGCGRCSLIGLIEVAWHFNNRQKVRECQLWWLHCDCSRGTYWAEKRAQVKDGDQPAPRGLQAAAWREDRQRQPNTVAVYINPTPAQRRADLTAPELSPSAAERLAVYLADIGLRAPPPSAPPPSVREWHDPEDRW